MYNTEKPENNKKIQATLMEGEKWISVFPNIEGWWSECIRILSNIYIGGVYLGVATPFITLTPCVGWSGMFSLGTAVRTGIGLGFEFCLMVECEY